MGYSLTTLHDFASTDGASPKAKLLADASGNLFGTTSRGGYYDGGAPAFKLDASSNYALTTLWTFCDHLGGPEPVSELIADASGNLYGTTYRGGSSNVGSFTASTPRSTTATSPSTTFDGPDGAHPVAGLLSDASGNLYGTTRENATVFRLDAANGWALATLHCFPGPGTFPVAPVLADAWGNLYGTTSEGGAFGYGTVFRLDAANGYALTTIHDFHGDDGRSPRAGGRRRRLGQPLWHDVFARRLRARPRHRLQARRRQRPCADDAALASPAPTARTPLRPAHPRRRGQPLRNDLRGGPRR